jgi:hypothetical protein
MISPWKIALRIFPRDILFLIFLPVKLAGQFLQCIADISGAPRDSLLSPAVLIILYSICFVLLIVELWFGRHEIYQGAQEDRVPDRP